MLIVTVTVMTVWYKLSVSIAVFLLSIVTIFVMENDQREQREISDDKVMFLEYLGLIVSIKGTNMIVFGVTQSINFLSYYLYSQKNLSLGVYKTKNN